MKKLLSLVISICIIAGFSTSIYAVDYGEELKNAPTKTYEQKFSDVPENYWAFSYISEMAERGVLSGYPDGKFYPNSQVTRAEFAKIMTVAAGLNIAEPTMQIFSDVKITDWHAPYVHAAKEYLSAYNQNGSSYYLPNTPALREDIAVALVKLKGYSTTGADMTALPRMFSDYQSISENAKIYVAAAIENGLISGYDDGTFRGQNSITRAEAATLLWRAYQYGNDNKTYDDITSTSDTAPSKDNAASDKKLDVNDDSAIIEDEELVVEVEERKPYVMRKLASANLSSSSMATSDDNNIYYIDEEDNCVYRINISNGKKTKYLDTSKLSYRETEKYETDTVEKVTKIVEIGEYEEIEEEITEIVIDEETGEETEVTKTVKNQVPITEEVTELEVKTIVEEAVVAEYDSFVPIQVFYDSIGDKLLLAGYYTNVWEVYKGPQTNEEAAFIYDISNNKEEMCVRIENDGCYVIQTVLNDEKIVVVSEGGSSYILNSKNGKLHKIYMEFSNYWDKGSVYTQYLLCVSGMTYNNRLFSFSGGCICEYDFGKDNYIELSDFIRDRCAYGIKDDCYYFWDTEMIYKISAINGRTTILEISTKYSDVVYEDMGNLKNMDYKFFVIDDSTIVFYDLDMEAFRILEKN